MFNGGVSLFKGILSGTKATISYASCKLSKTALEAIFDALGIGTSQTITVSINYGAVTPVALAGGTTAGSLTVTMASTTGVVAGDTMTGTGMPLTTGIAVTFQDAGDTVTLNAHGLSDADPVMFSVITTTTGIVINTIYYAVGVAANTFQVEATVGGGALPLTTDGTGTLKYVSKVVTINTDVSVVMDRPAVSTATNTLSFRALQIGKAMLKGWAVTGG
jgi:formylmethanofuran dehydrogenase subunit D